ncbi:phage antirepressor N-terminal domain-containing protein [Nitrosomonas communis]|uniref:phage antirepressor N-terminal domain-containing protein n=1 Tax=Nitrosomonas communis TaxID=44574 RepID=UPI0034E938CB|nr:hypothetical protein [Nitrosomonas communis]
MTCLPLRKLAAWLMAIHPHKVGPKLRGKLCIYQNECEESLWQYWIQGRTYTESEVEHG